jgi:hypothetical protein
MFDSDYREDKNLTITTFDLLLYRPFQFKYVMLANGIKVISSLFALL